MGSKTSSYGEAAFHQQSLGVFVGDVSVNLGPSRQYRAGGPVIDFIYYENGGVDHHHLQQWRVEGGSPDSRLSSISRWPTRMGSWVFLDRGSLKAPVRSETERQGRSFMKVRSKSDQIRSHPYYIGDSIEA